jgi:hypothetical protein
MNWGFGFDDAPLPVLGIRPGVTLYIVDILDQDTFIFAKHLEDFTDFAFVLTGKNFDLIVFF